MNTLKIKAVPPGEIDSVLEVYHECEGFLALGPDANASMQMVLRDMEEAAREGGVFRGIYTEDRLAGVLSYVPGNFEGNPSHAFLTLLMIIPSCRERRFGSRIVAMVEQEILADSRITSILSAVQVNNPRALKFWERNDYRISGGPEARTDGTTVFRLQKDFPAGNKKINQKE
ncbi:MAG: GNAT family N-acetyltransferase [Dehalococcoidales bacterium]|jgi:ribosomal protein S18 acetylase RimI-like enzyme